jgi:S-adenosyl-L-methionine hydrolase (adenosine-forming)
LCVNLRAVPAVITLTTDFGTGDGYVGAMKGVILSLLPGATVVDVTHEVPRHDVAAAAHVLATAAPLYPPGTVHLVVVDPGVGGARRALAVDDGRYRYVGPDNGVFARVLPSARAVHQISAPAFMRQRPSATFHGRDVFAPAAAKLAAGAAIAEAGPAVTFATPAAPEPGRVVHVDRFGNLITDIAGDGLDPSCGVRVGRTRIVGISRTYDDVTRGRVLAYVGSGGTLEIAVREGSAASKLGVKRGARVTLVHPAARGPRRRRGA